MPDYKQLLDAETWAYIEETYKYYPKDALSLTIEKQREVNDALGRAFFAGYPEGVTSFDSEIRGPASQIPIRIYRCGKPDAAAMVLYFHGGGFVVGGLQSHDDVCAEICGRTGYEVVSVDYRMAPEAQHPAAFEDALAAFDWASQNYAGAVIVAGDSAGGNLAAAVSHNTRNSQHRPAGQALIYPGLGGGMSRGSYLEHREAPLLATSDVLYCRTAYVGGADTSSDNRFEILGDHDFSGLPPTVIFPAECDPLASDGVDYHERILSAGGRAACRVERGLFHGFIRGRHRIQRAGRAFDRIVLAIAALGKGQWPIPLPFPENDTFRQSHGDQL